MNWLLFKILGDTMNILNWFKKNKTKENLCPHCNSKLILKYVIYTYPGINVYNCSNCNSEIKIQQPNVFDN